MGFLFSCDDIWYKCINRTREKTTLYMTSASTKKDLCLSMYFTDQKLDLGKISTMMTSSVCFTWRGVSLV